MNDSELDQLLTGSAPRSVGSDAELREPLLTMVAESRRAAAGTTHRRRRLLWIAAPLILAPTLAFGLTAGTEPRMVPDFTIPISYVTDTGATVSCSIDFYNGEYDYVETSFVAVDYLKTQDWTGVGQRIYAASLARVTTPDADLLDASTIDGVARTEAQIEQSSWNLTESDLIDGTIPEDILDPGANWGGNSDCTGQLH